MVELPHGLLVLALQSGRRAPQDVGLATQFLRQDTVAGEEFGGE
ncbi:hypothetical protein AB0A76_21785 [Streptomyces exfoliatus]|uniref:Uncharacterized protein n=1 Tax=Streptomyces exfoliatus TaxID=1905 RepID=A0ABV3D019_STREX